MNRKLNWRSPVYLLQPETKNSHYIRKRVKLLLDVGEAVEGGRRNGERRRQRGWIRPELEEVILDGEMTRNEGRGGETRGKGKTESDVRKRVMRERREKCTTLWPLWAPCRWRGRITTTTASFPLRPARLLWRQNNFTRKMGQMWEKLYQREAPLPKLPGVWSPDTPNGMFPQICWIYFHQVKK